MLRIDLMGEVKTPVSESDATWVSPARIKATGRDPQPQHFPAGEQDVWLDNAACKR